MIGVFSTADATVVAALIAAAVAILGWRQSARNSKQMKPMMKELQPNAGTSLRDAIDRIEKKVDHTVATVVAKIDDQVLPRLDGFATVQADHANRLAANEAAVVVTNVAVAALSQTKGT